MNTTILPTVLFQCSQSITQGCAEKGISRTFKQGEVVWLNTERKTRLGTWIANVSPTYTEGNRHFRVSFETYNLPKSVLIAT